MIEKNKVLGAVVVGLAIALASGAAMADRPHHAGPGPKGAVFDFAALDADSDGKVTKSEMAASRQTAAQALDSDGDGLISEAELAAMELKSMQERAEKRAKAMIARFDSDGDGKLSAAEMLTRPVPQGMFERLDRNNDGAVTQEEIDAAKARAHKHGRNGEGKRPDHMPHKQKPAETTGAN